MNFPNSGTRLPQSPRPSKQPRSSQPFLASLPPLADILERAHVVSLPMAVKFRGLRHREVVLIDGPAGWGEFAPFADYTARETAPWLRSGLEAAYQGFPSPNRDYIEVNATVPAVEPAQVPEVLSRMPGARCVKVKVAEPGKDFRDALADDIARVSAVREELSGIPGTRIRVDANGAWTVEQAVEVVSALAPLDYVEQPCATPEELAEVRTQLMRRGIFVRVAADESIRRVEDPYRVADLQAADVAVVKVAPLGGVRRVLQLSADLRARHMDVTIASALDSAVGINAGLAAVASLPKLNDDEDIDVAPAPAGLATGSLFLEDVAAPRSLVDGMLATAPVTPDADRLAALAADGATRDWWLDRLRAAYAQLEAHRARENGESWAPR